jgi:hypothetical protein
LAEAERLETLNFQLQVLIRIRIIDFVSEQSETGLRIAKKDTGDVPRWNAR